MPEIPDRKERFSQKYDSMQDDQLQNILRADASNPEGEESDIEEMFYVMELLAKRRSERGEARDPQKALEKFRNHYVLMDGTDLRSNELNSNSDIPVPHKRKATAFQWKRSIAVIAAVVAIVIMSVVSVGAAKFNLWETIARWTQETFHWGTAMDVNDHESETSGEFACSELQMLLDAHEITEKLVPTWLPQGYSLVDIQSVDRPTVRTIYAQYQSNNDVITIQIHDYSNTNPTQAEQSDLSTEIYRVNGTNYYLLDNNNQIQIAFIKSHFECSIFGSFSLDTAKLIIRSIEEE